MLAKPVSCEKKERKSLNKSLGNFNGGWDKYFWVPPYSTTSGYGTDSGRFQVHSLNALITEVWTHWS